MEAAEEEEAVVFERYTPCHPLPEEIRAMKRDDTVCQYCGVSYLIHNEIKAMEEKLKSIEAELQHYKGSEEREKQLKQKVNSLELLESELRQTLMAKDGIISTLQSDVRSGEGEKRDLSEKARDLENRLTDSLRDKNIIRSQLGRCRDQLPSILAEVRTQKSFVAEIQALLQRGETERKEELQRVLTKIRSKDRENRAIYDQKLLELEREKSDLEKSQKLLSAKYGEKEEGLQKSCDQLRNSLAERSEELEKSTSSLRMVTLELEQFRNHLRAKTQEIESLNSQLRSNALSHEQITQRLQTELAEKTGDVQALERQLKEAKNRLKELQNVEEEIRRTASVSFTESQDLKHRYERAQGDLDALKAEREVMIEAHQNRIAELKESFKNKMYEAEKWPEKLEAALQKERSKHSAEMSALEGKLKENFVLEMQIEKQKHQELLQKYLAEFKEKESKLLSSLEDRLRSEVTELQRQLAEVKKCAAEMEGKLREEIDSLKAIIRDLEDRLARAGTGSEEVVLQLREQLQQAGSDLHSAQQEVKVIQQQFDDKQKEVQFLQETVRRECEERFELTEALGEAREQLLAAHKPPGGYNHVTSKPVSRLDSTVSSRSTHSQSSFSKSPPNHSADSRPLTNQSAGSITPSNQNGASNRLSPTKIDSQISVGSSNRGRKSINSLTETASSVNVEFKKSPAKPSGKLKGKTIAENRKRIAALLGKR